MLLDKKSMRRGDTIVEAMFALAVFSLVAIISIALMNMGVRQAEGALEGVTARNEINAQAEALRFIHSSYISEMSLPDCSNNTVGNAVAKCQQYSETWQEIADRAVSSSEAADTGLLALGRKVMDGGCNQFYEMGNNGKTPLGQVNAFVINTRNVDGNGIGPSASYVPVSAKNKYDVPVFQAAELNARMIYTYGEENVNYNSTEAVSDGTTTDNGSMVTFDDVLYAEGIWVFAVKSDEEDQNRRPIYYDFYIETCWYTPNSGTPSTLDTAIRLYNPKGVRQ